MVSVMASALLLVLVSIYTADAGILEYTHAKTGGSRQPKVTVNRPLEDEPAVLEERAAALAREIAAMCQEYFERDDIHTAERRSDNEESNHQEETIQRICMEILQKQSEIYWRMP